MKPKELWQQPYKTATLSRGPCGTSATGVTMRACRKTTAMSLRGRDAVAILLSRARIVTEPKKLAYLNAEAEKNNAKRRRITCRK